MGLLFIWVRRITIFLLLTVFTQIGGLVQLLCLLLFPHVKLLRHGQKWARLKRGLAGILVYLVTIALIVPPIAAFFGRVPLPIHLNRQSDLMPAHYWTCLMNRHYVSPDLLQALQDITANIRNNQPGFQIYYLDANFPFWDGFPLFPHLSHDDGMKLDVSFVYRKSDGTFLEGSPSLLGYGYVEAPHTDEPNTAEQCTQKGYWQYSLLEKLVWKNASSFQFDQEANQVFIRTIAQHPLVEKIFMEPHLQKRLGLQEIEKIRFHGCHSVRHDDHIHFQIAN